MFQNAYTMLAMSLERYIAIMHPFLRRLGKRNCLQVVALCWLLAFLTPIPTAVTARLHEHLNWGEDDPSAGAAANASSGATAGYDDLGTNISRLLLISSQGQGGNAITTAAGSGGGVGAVGSGSLFEGDNIGAMTPAEDGGAGSSNETYWLCYENWATERQRISYTMTIMFLQYFLPLGVLVFTYARIVHVIWLKDKQQAAPGQLLAPPGPDGSQTVTYVPNAKEKGPEKEPDPRKKVLLNVP